jgi:hypothetical protein
LRSCVSLLRPGKQVLRFGAVVVSGLVVAFAPAAAHSSTSLAPPSINLNISGTPGDNGCYRSDVGVSWTVSDPTGISASSGCGPTVLRNDTDGTTLTCSASNNARPPLSNSVSVTIKIDKTVPVFRSVSVTPGDGTNFLQWKLRSRSDWVRIDRSLRGATSRASNEAFRGRRGESFADTGIQNGREYVYTLAGHDAAGNISKPVSVRALPRVLLLQKLPYVPRVSVAPILRWGAEPGATYYHVQVFRGGKRILAAWPGSPQLSLRSTWSWRGHRYRLDPGTYRWYVWAGLGSRSRAHYKRLGTAAFSVRA